MDSQRSYVHLILCYNNRDLFLSTEGEIKMNINKKEILIFSSLVIFTANVMWGIGYYFRMIDEGSISSVLPLIVACFIPLITALSMCAVTKTEFATLKVKPNIIKSRKIYLLAILVGLILVYSSDLLPLFVFPKDVSIASDSKSILFFGKIVLFTVISVIESIELLGEELGWMGYLYPRLEKEFGTFLGIVLVAVVRTLYHFVALILIAGSVNGAIIAVLSLLFNNLFLQSVLVYVTKKSDSVFPASIIHAISNILVTLSFVTYPDGFDESIPFRVVGLIPVVIIGILFGVMLFKNEEKREVEI